MAQIDPRFVQQAARRYGLRPDIFAKLISAESGGSTTARSPAGAIGPAQLMPGTARGLGVDPYNPRQNVLGGAKYLSQQLKSFGGRYDLALSAYNSGPGGSERSGRVENIPETANYVRKILGGSLANAKKGGSIGAYAQRSNLAYGPATSNKAEFAMRLIDAFKQPDSTTAMMGALMALRQSGGGAAAPSGGAAPGGFVGPISGGGKATSYQGQRLTHETSGLPGYPAVDLFAKPGSPFIAPESGTIVRHSGHPGTTSGQVYGSSIYFKGDSGKTYFVTHLGKVAPKGRYKRGQPLGTVSAWSGGSPHAHVGVHG